MTLELSSIRFAGDFPEIALSAEEVAARDADVAAAALGRYLANAVEVTVQTFPGLYSIISSVASLLEQSSWRAFVYSDWQHSASCFLVNNVESEEVQPILAVSGQLIRDFSEAGIKFVIGHEFGHAMFEHHGYPCPEESESDSERSFLLELRRAAELTADRVGLLVVQDRDSAIRACLQMASGLPEAHLGQYAANSFLQQLPKIVEDATHCDFEDYTHPPLPLRALNIDLLSRSNVFRGPDKAHLEDSLGIEEVDERLFEAMGQVRGGRGVSSATKCADLAAFWAVAALFSADNRYTRSEQDWMQLRFGKRLSTGALRFMKNHGRESTHQALIRFRRHCPQVRDARQILRRVTKELILEASTASACSDNRKNRVLKACLEMLESRQT